MTVALDPALIVEDDVATQQRLARLLSTAADSDTRIAVASGVAEAKAHIAGQTPAIALIDIGLPDGSGIELIRWLRHHHPRCDDRGGLRLGRRGHRARRAAGRRRRLPAEGTRGRRD